MFGPASGIGLAIGGAALGYGQAREQNRAVRRSAASARRGAAVQTAQLNDAAAVERQRRRREAQQILGRIRVAAAASGFATDSGDFITLEDQNAIDLGTDIDIINRNEQAQIDRVQSGLEADLVSLQSRTSSALVAAFSSGISGAQAGLQIGGAVDQYNERARAEDELRRVTSQGGLEQ